MPRCFWWCWRRAASEPVPFAAQAFAVGRAVFAVGRAAFAVTRAAFALTGVGRVAGASARAGAGFAEP
jgi:hypothetical protein